MKLIYENNGYRVFGTKILGYPCRVHQTKESGCLVSVPMGEGEDKEMFDSLVYYHKGEYWGKTKTEARKKVFNFIKKYKEKKLCQNFQNLK